MVWRIVAWLNIISIGINAIGMQHGYLVFSVSVLAYSLVEIVVEEIKNGSR